ncbi:ATP-dependent Lon protease pim1, partial [Spiromyces aspiralis]
LQTTRSVLKSSSDSGNDDKGSSPGRKSSAEEEREKEGGEEDNNTGDGGENENGEAGDGRQKPSLPIPAGRRRRKPVTPTVVEEGRKSRDEQLADKEGEQKRSPKSARSEASATEPTERQPSPHKSSPLDQLRKAVGVLEANSHRQSVPEEYPNVLALPLVRRPLFPGFYKAVVVKNPQVTAAIKELLQRGEPFVGAFMLKDDDADVDVISNINEVHSVGVFAQITSVFPSTNQDEESLTAVLYPHRRIKLLDVLPPPGGSGGSIRASVGEVEGEEGEAVGPEPQTAKPKSQHDSSARSEGEPGAEKQPEDTVLEVQREYGFTVGEVENLSDHPYNGRSQVIRAITSEIVAVFKDIAALNPLFRDQIANFSMSQSAGNVFDDPARLADFAAAVSAGDPQELQNILEERNVGGRLEKALLVLKKELMNAQLQNKISKDVEAKIAKRQREFYLMEQLKGIKRELGLESDGKDKLIEKFKGKAEKLAMPEEVKKVFDEEINKLAHLEPAASEFNMTRNYLDWLTQVPWGKFSHEEFDLAKSRKVLDEDHYGLEDVKKRILEFIAVGKLRGAVEGKVLCFVGPPGVGKTSIGKSIARSLGREFYRFSVGGLSDVAEIKGHRRTYVGAMPGKVVQALKKVQTENPLILIDEIDKLGRGHQGDPASALLELLDPEQNNSFLDHYMDVSIDLSRVLFVCTANVSDTIPGPLLDRMEVIRLSGYLADEKMAIAKRYLAPQAKEMAGLADADVKLTDDAIDALVRHYCRESGVRNLKKHIEKIFRKAALKVVEDDVPLELEEEAREEGKSLEAKTRKSAEIPGEQVTSPNPAGGDHSEKRGGGVDVPKVGGKAEGPAAAYKPRPMRIPEDYSLLIDSAALKDYVGPPVFESDRLYETTPPGVVMGLAWTSMGGSALYIESVVKSRMSSKASSSSNGEASEQRGNLQVTGQLGDVMKESSTLAYTYVQSLMNHKFPDNTFFSNHFIHLHVPEGATPKDGPSAGVTMTTSLLSLALNKPVRPDVAMTGELTLTGKVLKIGGLKEKTIAAKRSGIKRILFPKANLADWEELPENIKEGLEGYPIDWYEQVPPLVGLYD